MFRASIVIACLICAFAVQYVNAELRFLKRGNQPKTDVSVCDAVLQKGFYDTLGLSDEHLTELRALESQWNEPVKRAAADGEFSDDELIMIRESKEELAPLVVAKYQQIVGDRYAETVRAINRKLLAYSIRKDGISDDPSFLSTTVLRNELNLNVEQATSIKEIANAHAEQIRQFNADFLNDLYRDFTKREAAMLEELSPDQRDTYREIYGTPYMWLALPKDEKMDVVTRANIDSEVQILRFRGNPKGGAENKSFDYLWFSLISTSEIWGELELAGMQLEELKTYLEKMGKFASLTSETRNARIQTLLEGIDVVPHELKEILLPHQIRRLGELEFQLRVFEYRSTLGLKHPLVSRALSLSQKQLEKLDELAAKFDMMRQEKLEKYQKQFQTKQKKTYHQMIALLSDAQRADYELNVGTLYSEPQDNSGKE